MTDIETELRRFKDANLHAQKEIARVEKQRDDLFKASLGLLHFIENYCVVNMNDHYVTDFISAVKNACDDEEERAVLGVPILFRS